ncbi:MAG TPA: hypothetical protein VNI01_15420, partial [Elusimicrobiota bacterium]|nr:hypothetical protein [Elusimicrobiota bacterium]
LLLDKLNRRHRPLGALVPGFPPEAQAVVERALDPDPEARWASAGELSRAFKEALAPIRPTPPGSLVPRHEVPGMLG